MKLIIKKLPFLFAASLMFFASNTFAYEDEKPKEDCRTPKLYEFSLPVYNAQNKVEVAPESEFSFMLSNWVDPDEIKVTAKNIPLTLKIEDKKSFYSVTAKLPAELTGKYARINVLAKAVLGCRLATGWLIKIASVDTTARSPTEAKSDQAAKTETTATETKQETPASAE